MNLNQLYYFQTLAKCEHYTQASKELFISQPSLSYAMKELEKELGCPLFYKNGRNIKLTHEGVCFLKYVTKSLETLDEGIQSLQSQSHQVQQTIHISVIPTIVNHYLAPLIRDINKNWPQIQMRFRSQKTLDIIQGVKENKYEFGICSKISNDNLNYLPVLHENLVLIVAKNHPLSKKKKISLKDISKYPLITYQKEISIYTSVMNLFEDYHIVPDVLYELDDETSIASMVSQGFGVAIVAKNELLKPFNNIDIIDLTVPGNQRLIYLVYNPQRKLNPTTAQIIDYIVSYKLDI